jgi:hypothetical protein
MNSEDVHFVFIAWSFAGVTLAVLGLVAYVAWESYRVKARLAALDKAGIRRRSSGAGS